MKSMSIKNNIICNLEVFIMWRLKLIAQQFIWLLLKYFSVFVPCTSLWVFEQCCMRPFCYCWLSDIEPYGPAVLGPRGPVSAAPLRPGPCHQAPLASCLTPAPGPLTLTLTIKTRCPTLTLKPSLNPQKAWQHSEDRPKCHMKNQPGHTCHSFPSQIHCK